MERVQCHTMWATGVVDPSGCGDTWLAAARARLPLAAWRGLALPCRGAGGEPRLEIVVARLHHGLGGELARSPSASQMARASSAAASERSNSPRSRSAVDCPSRARPRSHRAPSALALLAAEMASAFRTLPLVSAQISQRSMRGSSRYGGGRRRSSVMTANGFSSSPCRASAPANSSPSSRSSGNHP